FLHLHDHHRDLHSFPTRRSSDLGHAQRVPVPTGSLTELVSVLDKKVTVEEVNAAMQAAATESFGYNTDPIVSRDIVGISYGSLRSEEHTSELQSRFDLVCRLLLE